MSEFKGYVTHVTAKGPEPNEGGLSSITKELISLRNFMPEMVITFNIGDNNDIDVLSPNFRFSDIKNATINSEIKCSASLGDLYDYFSEYYARYNTYPLVKMTLDIQNNPICFIATTSAYSSSFTIYFSESIQMERGEPTNPNEMRFMGGIMIDGGQDAYSIDVQVEMQQWIVTKTTISADIMGFTIPTDVNIIKSDALPPLPEFLNEE